MGSLSLLFGWTLSSCPHFKMASNWMVSELGTEASYETTWTIRQFSQIINEYKVAEGQLSSKFSDVLDYGSVKMYFRRKSGAFFIRILTVPKSSTDLKGKYTLSILKAERVVWQQEQETPSRDTPLRGVPTPLPTKFLEDDSLTLHLRIDIRGIIKRSYDVPYSPPPSPPVVANSFASDCLNTGQYSDCVITCQDGTEFKCHKIVLAPKSRVFHAMFSAENMQEAMQSQLRIVDIEPNTLAALLKYLYTGDVDASQSAGLLVAADKYDLQPLKQACESNLVKGLNGQNVVDLLLLADRHHAKDLKEGALQLLRSSGELLMGLCQKNQEMASTLQSMEGLHED